MSVNIQLEWTPNPSTLKYVVDRALLPNGAVNFTDTANPDGDSTVSNVEAVAQKLADAL